MHLLELTTTTDVQMEIKNTMLNTCKLCIDIIQGQNDSKCNYLHKTLNADYFDMSN